MINHFSILNVSRLPKKLKAKTLKTTGIAYLAGSKVEIKILQMQTLTSAWASAEKNAGGQKHSRDGHLSESYSQVSVNDRVTN